MSVSVEIDPRRQVKGTSGLVSGTKFWDRIARKYAAQPVKNVAAYRATLDRVRSYLRPGDRMLEVGCGTGSTALTLAGEVESYVASDVSPGMIGIAREKLAADGAPNLEFTVAPVVETRFDAGSFDVVFGSSIYHLVDDLGASLRRAHELLKPGGLFISKTPCLGEMSRLIRLAIPVMRFFGKAPDTVLNFTKAELEASIRKAGFEIVEARAFEGAPNSWFVVARKI
ncbi:MAG: class I SAM-dependent methyltransferase [Rhodobacter sp.]|nr:class I SAM-dependent methyltransferase [Rhodobacter sp.]